MSKFADKRFWVDAGDRAVTSFAQALLTTGVFESTGLLNVDWVQMFSLAGGYAVASVLTSIVFRGNSDGEISAKHADL